MEWRFLIEKMYCSSNSYYLTLFLILLIKGHYCNHLSRFTTRDLQNRRYSLRNLVRRNRTLYDAVVLELLKRRLGISRHSPVSRPVTVDLSNSFPQQENAQQTVNQPFQQPRTEVNQPVQQTNTFNEPLPQQTFTRSHAVVGTPLQLMSNRALSETNNLQQTNNLNSNIYNGVSKSPSQKTQTNTNERTVFGGSVSMGKNGFVFDTASGVRFRIPSKSGRLVIKRGRNGIEFRYMTTPRPRRKNEEEEIETK